jgi:hypothetical protein
VATAGVGALAPPDKFGLWEKGAFRGANVPQETTTEDLRVLRSWGANLAQIPAMGVYDPNPPHSFRPAELEKLDEAISAAEWAGLFVVLTCRGGPGRDDNAQNAAVWQEAKAQAAYARMWQRVASHYRGRRSVVGYDLMWEPHPDDAAPQPLGDWNALAKRITEAIRLVDKETPILVKASGRDGPQMFDSLEPTGDPKTVYVVHFEEPERYARQGPAEGIAYPGLVPADEGPEQSWDQTTIEQTLFRVRRFQNRNKVPVFVGEFGCPRWAPGAVEFLRDQTALYGEWGWSWAYSEFRGPDAMDIEKSPEAADARRHADTPLLKLFRSQFARNKIFPEPPKAEKGLPPLGR